MEWCHGRQRVEERFDSRRLEFPQGQRACIGKEMRFSQCLGQACWLGRAPSPHCLNWTSSTPTSIYWSLCTLILIWILSLMSLTTEQVHKFVKFKGGVFSLSKRGIHLVDGQSWWFSDEVETHFWTSYCLVCKGSDKSGSMMWLLQFSVVQKIPLVSGKGPGIWDFPTGEVQEVGK